MFNLSFETEYEAMEYFTSCEYDAIERERALRRYLSNSSYMIEDVFDMTQEEKNDIEHMAMMEWFEDWRCSGDVFIRELDEE